MRKKEKKKKRVNPLLSKGEKGRRLSPTLLTMLGRKKKKDDIDAARRKKGEKRGGLRACCQKGGGEKKMKKGTVSLLRPKGGKKDDFDHSGVSRGGGHRGLTIYSEKGEKESRPTSFRVERKENDLLLSWRKKGGEGSPISIVISRRKEKEKGLNILSLPFEEKKGGERRARRAVSVGKKEEEERYPDWCVDLKKRKKELSSSASRPCDRGEEKEKEVQYSSVRRRRGGKGPLTSADAARGEKLVAQKKKRHIRT